MEEGNMKAIIYLTLGLLIVAYVLPVGLSGVYQTNTTAFAWNGIADTATVNIWKLIPLFAAIGVVIMLIFGLLKGVVAVIPLMAFTPVLSVPETLLLISFTIMAMIIAYCTERKKNLLDS